MIWQGSNWLAVVVVVAVLRAEKRVHEGIIGKKYLTTWHVCNIYMKIRMVCYENAIYKTAYA